MSKIDNIEKGYQMCNRCVMDTTEPDIFFDNNGICNHCKEYFEKEKKFVYSGKVGETKIKEIVNKIKKDGQNKKYDCVLGISGGVDSCYVAYLAQKYNLRVLLINLDNGYDTEIAKNNILKIIKNTNFDLLKIKIDFEEFKDLQLAFLKASVIDVEMVTDHAIIAAIYDIANKNKIKYILSGTNVVTEYILPKSWRYFKNDLRNLKNIHKKYGKMKMNTFPTLGQTKLLFYEFIRGIRYISLLDYIDYNKERAKKIIQDKFGWEDYGGKHYESIFTKFYQAYILPTKFGIDKRKAHFSTLICSGQITREEALKELDKPLYKKKELDEDQDYVLKKLGLSEKEFDYLMKLPIKKHQEYGVQKDDFIYSLFKESYTFLFRKD
jgi:N-acetyl sugar amidotransferase